MCKHLAEGDDADAPKGFTKDVAEGLYKMAELGIELVVATFGLVVHPLRSAGQGELCSSFDTRGPSQVSTLPFILAVIHSLCAQGNLLDLRLWFDAAKPFMRLQGGASVELNGGDFLRAIPGAWAVYGDLVVSRRLLIHNAAPHPKALTPLRPTPQSRLLPLNGGPVSLSTFEMVFSRTTMKQLFKEEITWADLSERIPGSEEADEVRLCPDDPTTRFREHLFFALTRFFGFVRWRKKGECCTPFVCRARSGLQRSRRVVRARVERPCSSVH